MSGSELYEILVPSDDIFKVQKANNTLKFYWTRLSKTLIYNISSGITELYMAAHFDVMAIFTFLHKFLAKG